jgi:hypothetical protein
VQLQHAETSKGIVTDQGNSHAWPHAGRGRHARRALQSSIKALQGFIDDMPRGSASVWDGIESEQKHQNLPDRVDEKVIIPGTYLIRTVTERIPILNKNFCDSMCS